MSDLERQDRLIALLQQVRDEFEKLHKMMTTIIERGNEESRSKESL